MGGGEPIAISSIRSRTIRHRISPPAPGRAPDEPFDRTLIAARAGADWAWEAIYSQFAPAVLGYLRARGAAEPDDLLGEIFVQLVRDLARFSGDERDFRAWLFTIAHHRLLDDRWRRGRRQADPVPSEAIAEIGPVANAEEEALERLDAERVRALIGALAPEQQNVLLLRVLGDLTVEQVARALGKRAGAVKALQRRGLAAIAKQLDRGA